MTLKHFPHHWPFVMGIHQCLVVFPTKGLVMWSFDCNFVLNTKLSWLGFETSWRLSGITVLDDGLPDSKVHGANMGPTWVLSSPGGPHVGPMNLAIWAIYLYVIRRYGPVLIHQKYFEHTMGKLKIQNCNSAHFKMKAIQPLLLKVADQKPRMKGCQLKQPGRNGNWESTSKMMF